MSQTEYEFQVLGICGSLTGAASETVSMITSEEPFTNFTCGAGPDAFELENQDPLPELQWGDVFKAGDVEVTVLNVKGDIGTFSGKGLAEMPWLRHVKLQVRVDYVNATAEGKGAFPGFIGFRTPSMPMASQPTDKDAEKQVNLVGGMEGQTDQLIAFAFKEDEKGNEIEHELGVLNLVSYAKVRNKVVLVPMNGATVPGGNRH